MTVSPQEAASALREIESAEARSRTLHAYARSSPHFVLWGVLWAVGYGLDDFLPAYGKAIWAAIVPIGLAAGFAVARRTGESAGWRYGAVALTLFGFFAAVFAIMSPIHGRQVAAVVPLTVAAGFVLTGLWRGTRFILAGIALAGLTLAGFFLLAEHFFLWMAAVGGASLVLAGLWLRRV